MFISYDLESNGYRIHWPKKKTISVKHDLVFNKNDINSNNNSITIPGDALDKGERDKIIHSPNPVPLSVKLADGLELDHNLKSWRNLRRYHSRQKVQWQKSKLLNHHQLGVVLKGWGINWLSDQVFTTTQRQKQLTLRHIPQTIL